MPLASFHVAAQAARRLQVTATWFTIHTSVPLTSVNDGDPYRYTVRDRAARRFVLARGHLRDLVANPGCMPPAPFCTRVASN